MCNVSLKCAHSIAGPAQVTGRHLRCLHCSFSWPSRPIDISVQDQLFVPHFDATTGKRVCLSLGMNHPLRSQHGREIHASSEHHSPRVKPTQTAVTPLHSHPPFGKSFPPFFLFFVQKVCTLILKYGLWFCPLWTLQFTRKKGVNLSGGSSPVLRPLWLAIRYICQARVTWWLWRTGTGGDEWEISSAAIPPLQSWLPFPVTCSFSTLACQLSVSSRSLATVECGVCHSLELSLTEETETQRLIHYSICVRGI